MDVKRVELHYYIIYRTEEEAEYNKQVTVNNIK